MQSPVTPASPGAITIKSSNGFQRFNRGIRDWLVAENRYFRLDRSGVGGLTNAAVIFMALLPVANLFLLSLFFYQGNDFPRIRKFLFGEE